MDQLDLSDFFKTKTQANDFSARIATISELIYTNNFSLEKALGEHLGIEKKDKFITLLRQNEIAIDSSSVVKGFLDKIQESISKTPLTPLTIAFEPTDKTLAMISDWFLLHLQKHVIFDITVDPSLIAGAAITFNGKYFDFSVKQQFEQIVQDVIAKPPHDVTVTHQNGGALHLGR